MKKKIQARSNVFNKLPLFKKDGDGGRIFIHNFWHNIYMEGDIENSIWLLLGRATCLGINSGWCIFMVYSFVTCVLDFFDIFPATNKEIKINVLV